jgi:hypothetical protein
VNRILPFPGPLHDDPTPEVYALVGPVASWALDKYPAKDLCRAQLAAAVEGLELGDYDRRVLEFLGGCDIPTIATVASLIGRAREAGRVTLAEVAAGATVDVIQLRVALRAITDAAATADAALTDEGADRQSIAEHLIHVIGGALRGDR